MRHGPTERRLAAGLLAFGLLLRLAVAIGARGGPYDPYVRLDGDSADYLSLGLSLSRGEGYSFHYRPWLREMLQGREAPVGPSVPTAMRSPGYPLLLASVFALAGPRLHLVIVLQVLMSACVPLLVYLIAREVKAPALTSLAFAVFYVPFWFDAARVMSEGLLTFCVTLGLWLLVRPGSGWLAGAAAGFAMLVKSVAAPLFVPAALLLGRRRALPYLVGVAAMVLPWMARNAAHTGVPTLAPALGGYQVFLLHNPLNRGLSVFSRPGDQNEDYAGFQALVREVRARPPRRSDPVAQEYAEDRALLVEALRHIRSEPLQALRAGAASVVNLWRFDTPIAFWREGPSLPNQARWLSALVLCAGLMPFAAVGLIGTLRSGPPSARPVALFLLAFVILHATVSAGLRYRTAVMPPFFVMAAWGLARFRDVRRARANS